MTDSTAAAHARAAYRTFEPFHISAYFNPELGAAGRDTGLDGHAWYVGSRAEPMAPCAAGVVAAAFYSFNTTLIERSWPAAIAAGLDTVARRRWDALDTVLGGALGESVSDPGLTSLADRLHGIGDTLTFAGRPLSAAWHQSSAPDVPHLQLWHAIAVLREWRGDGHLAALLDADLDPTEAGVFHEAQHPEPGARRVLGRRITQLTREWSDEQWDSAAERLAARGLVTTADGVETLTDDGVALDRHIEGRTDAMAAAAWRGVDDAEELISSARPYVKAVISAGILPGTKKKG
ncbi:hypothetical protein [Rhodococcus sp. SORGH_AS_0303]|uniref:SCO6745 family protein n=1 Tax=Rhodococcus sp. SORGH_AS_0303 TaxID=3041753 RepID=UPI002787B728|nr:hypothetical protein [Rhodococcus sp. SORGH_AS_0303]MDQ1200441.1 hypothetical protein [Rhodococcus sp. SORGH_AS_0303]